MDSSDVGVCVLLTSVMSTFCDPRDYGLDPLDSPGKSTGRVVFPAWSCSHWGIQAHPPTSPLLAVGSSPQVTVLKSLSINGFLVLVKKDVFY